MCDANVILRHDVMCITSTESNNANGGCIYIHCLNGGKILLKCTCPKGPVRGVASFSE
jgi:hypothetical protein